MANEFVARNGIIALDDSIVTGSLTVTLGITGSLFGSASYAATASNILGGSVNYIPFFNGSTNLSSSVIYQSGNNIGIGIENPASKLHISSSTAGIFEIDGPGSLNILYVSASGNIGVGMITPNYDLDVSGSIRITGSLALGNITPSATNGRLDATNDIVAYSTSDIRFKTNITPIQDSLLKLKSINGVEFDWIPNEKLHGYTGHDVGVIAQELEKILPEVVTTRDSGYKAVKYEKIIPLLIEAIKELSKKVTELENSTK